jgi:alkanesulfonate monooxygenase SsuD/methylene tetrahydromethanopterin reductase-like flavin-dependent oxidoreductase (luciferase family)
MATPTERRLKVGFKTAPIRVDWSTLASVWARAGELDCFDSAWVYDHFYPNDGDGPCFEGTVILPALASLVPNARVGHLVLANPYRHPAVVAKIASAMDHISGGRFVLGLGAGWHIPETTAYGMPLAPIGERLTALRSAVAVIRALISSEASVWPTDGRSSSQWGGVSLEASPYGLDHARNDPPPIQGARLPIWLGVQGERVGLKIAAEVADGWNFSGVGTVADFARKRELLRRFAEVTDRDPAEIEVSAQLRVDPADPSEAVARCRAFVAAGCDHIVLYVDPAAGPKMITELARNVVAPLRDLYG